MIPTLHLLLTPRTRRQGPSLSLVYSSYLTKKKKLLQQHKKCILLSIKQTADMLYTRAWFYYHPIKSKKCYRKSKCSIQISEYTTWSGIEVLLILKLRLFSYMRGQNVFSKIARGQRYRKVGRNLFQLDCPLQLCRLLPIITRVPLVTAMAACLMETVQFPDRKPPFIKLSNPALPIRPVNCLITVYHY